MELKGKKINFLGDSITEGVGTSAREFVFTEVIARECGALTRNYGISGTRYARQHKPSDDPNFDRDFCSRVDKMAPDADIIVVFGGTNDYGHGDAEFGTPDDRTPDTFWGAAHTLYRSLIERYPSAQIVILTPLHREGESLLHNVGPNHPPVPLEGYVEVIRAAAEYYALPVLDLYRVGGMQPDVPVIRERYMPDGLHPNNAGHRILADKLIAFLKAL